MNFGEKLEQLRIKSGLNKKQLGERVGLSGDTIGQYIKKSTVDGIETSKLKSLADFFEISVDYFVYNDEQDFRELKEEELKYLISKDGNNIDIIEFLNEVKYYIDKNNLTYNGKELEEQKKYLINSLDIGLKFIKQKL